VVEISAPEGNREKIARMHASDLGQKVRRTKSILNFDHLEATEK
jgi:hypothetical protein